MNTQRLIRSEWKVSTLICNCQNQNWLDSGSTCDICMGLILPSVDAQPDNRDTQTSMLDESYFEWLELRYDDVEYAA